MENIIFIDLTNHLLNKYYVYKMKVAKMIENCFVLKKKELKSK